MEFYKTSELTENVSIFSCAAQSLYTVSEVYGLFRPLLSWHSA